MTQVYRTDDFARWGSGQGFNLSPAQVDINFWDLVQRMLAQEARPDPSAGIDHFEIVGTAMYVHMTDGTVLGPYELPVATFRDRGVWTPDTAYAKMDTFSADAGLYVVVFPHTSDSSFDPGANDGAGNDYYQLMIQTFPRDVTHDAAIFVPGSIQRTAGALLFQGIANRTMQLASGNAHAYARLETGNAAGGATDIIVSIKHNATEIGTITFAAGGGQSGTFSIPAVTDFAAGDRYALAVTQSDQAAPADLSVTLPFIRTDI